MKKLLAVLTALMVLFCTTGFADGVVGSMLKKNDAEKEWYETCIETLIADYNAGDESDAIAICLHYYYDLYNDCESLSLPLTFIWMKNNSIFRERYESRSKQAKEAERIMFSLMNELNAEYEKAYTAYLNGEKTAGEYIEFIKQDWETAKAAREKTEKQLNEAK